ncbi:MAG: ABC transporter permease [Bryobacteraceae bacterium]|nr:ABC transporter permease [Bryobacteraceae bacterium]
MGTLLADVRFALRTLRRSPLFTAVAVLSLALGIGANTAIFTLVDQLILRLLPVQDPERLVMIWTTGPHMGSNRGSRAMSYPMYQDFQSKGAAFSHMFCRYRAALSSAFEGRTERVNAELVSGNYFEALGVRPERGRLFTPREDDVTYKGHPVVVLSHRYWANRFGRDDSVIGKKMLVNNYPMTIVGVSGAGFYGLDPSTSPDVFVPVQMKPLMTPGWDSMGDRRSQWIQTFARLKPGFTVESAAASLQPLLSQILQDEASKFKHITDYYRDRFLKRTIRMVPAAAGYSQLRESYSKALLVLMAMVGLVLLIACTNVANLLIARAVARQKEVAVRLAIGASRGQLLRQLLIESVLLSVAGGVLGLFFAVAVIRGLLSFLGTGDSNLILRAEPDLRILGFTFALSVVAGVLFGLAPALQALKLDLWDTLKDVVGAVAGGGASVRLRKVLVTAQVALSFLLLAGAGLFVKTLANLKTTDSGFHDIGNLVTFQVDPALNGYKIEQMHAFYRQALENIRTIPGVKSAATTTVAVLAGDEWDSSMSVEGHQVKDGEDMQAFMNSISPGYWKTMGIQVLEGRDFDERDRGEKMRVAIVNQKFAKHFFGDRSAIGRHIGFGVGPQTKLDIEIVGVVEDHLYEGPREGVRRQVFVAVNEMQFPASATFYVRAGIDSKSLFSALREKIRQIDSALPVYSMKTLENQLDETLGTERLIAALSAAFGVLATLLAAIGLYGVMAFTVARRTKEIGLRMALGAKQSTVVSMVLKEVLLLLAAGLAIGIPAAYFLAKYVSSQLFGVKPDDVASAAVAVAVLTLVAAAAGFIPARRASAIDPLHALRYE